MNILKQRGNTLLGIIIGLIIGLAIAVVVALVITKGSSPFVNKVSRAASSESAGASAPLGDPNKPLYSDKNAAKEAAKELKASSEAPVQAEVAVTPPAPEAKAEVKSEVKPSEDKLDKLVDKALAGKLGEIKAENSEEKWTYYLQAGAFREQDDAENTRAKLALLGFEANIVERKLESGVLYRVQIGPYDQAEAMNRVRGKLLENGVDVAVVRNQK
jgi:cell division protein FtsN